MVIVEMSYHAMACSYIQGYSWRIVCEISRCSEYITCNELAEVADICLSREFVRSQNVRNR